MEAGDRSLRKGNGAKQPPLLPWRQATHHIDGRVPGIVPGEFGITASERGERGEAI